MLTAEMNERLTRVGPGTPMGEMMRRYWQPFAAVVELKERPTKKVRLLGEDLALFRDGSGRYGLLAENCPHRRVSLVYGVPEDEGIRCPYHGWLYDTEGNCLEQPAEAANSTFKDRIHTTAYPVQAMGGLLFAYMGPAPVPELPKFDFYVQPNSLRQIRATTLPCNWLQIMENSLDPMHTEWLHNYYSNYVKTGQTRSTLGAFPQRRHERIGFDVFEYGIIKRRIYEGAGADNTTWNDGHPVVLPNILKHFDGFQIRVPVDDETTREMRYDVICFSTVTAPVQDEVPLIEEPYLDAEGNLLVTQTREEDMMAWITQGPIADRTQEHVGASDLGVLTYRRLLQEQIIAVAEGRDPRGVVRDGALNAAMIPLPGEAESMYTPKGDIERLSERLQRDKKWLRSPIREQFIELFLEAARKRSVA